MKCREALVAMHAALDGEASAQLLAQLDEHLRQCPSCPQEHEDLWHWDTVLRAREVDEPGDTYFDALARKVSAGVRERERRAARRLVPSWGFSWASAAVCLVLGLAVGRLAFPRTVTRTQTVVKSMPGPAPTITVERVVEKPVHAPVQVGVPVVRWRTRTLVREAPASSHGAPAPDVAYAPTTPAMPVASTPSKPHEVVGTRLATDEQPTSQPGSGRVYYAMWRPSSSGDAGLSRAEMTALARRLTADVSTLDHALNSPRLAETLVSNVDSAGVELEKAIQPAASEEPHH